MIGSQVFALFLPLFKEGIQATIRWLLLRGPVLLRTSAIVSLIGCVWAGWSLHSDVSKAEELIYRALGTRMEDINQPNAGLQAALLAEFDRGLDTFLGQAKVKQSFVTSYQRLITQLHSDVVPKADVVVKPSESGPITDRYFSESGGNMGSSFLFLPAFLMRGRDVLKTTSDPAFTDTELLRGLELDQSLTWDVQHTRTAGADICDLNNTVVFEPPSSYEAGTTWVNSTPVQSYLITSSGVLRICEAKQASQERYYEPRFKATTFFPERNYFISTVENTRALSSGQPLDQAFYVRRPYIDLGGNGVVISLCKELSLRRPSDSALCMDFAIGENAPTTTGAPKAISDKLSERIIQLGGRPEIIHCNVTPPVAPGQKSSWTCKDQSGHAYSNIENKATNDYKRDLSELFGKINTSYPAPSGNLRFTVPLANTGESSGDLLFAQLDITPVRHRSTWEAILFGISLFCFVSSVALLIGDYGLRLKETHAALDQVGVVMSHVPVAYCRVDSDHRFVDWNVEFEHMVESDADLRKQDFKMYVTSSGLKQYEAEVAKRIAGESSEYDLEMKSTKGRSFEVRVFGAPVPEPRSSKGKKPQTFAVLIRKAKNVTPLTVAVPEEFKHGEATGS